MSDARTDLARHLHSALSKANTSADRLSECTKVPRTTILHLLAEPVSAILPERVYLRGHLGVLGRELRADVAHLERLFDQAYPEVEADPESPDRRRFRAQSMAVSATLGGVAVLSVVAAFISALD